MVDDRRQHAILPLPAQEGADFSLGTRQVTSEALANEWTNAGGEGDWGPPQTWQQVQQYSEFLRAAATSDESGSWRPT